MRLRVFAPVLFVLAACSAVPRPTTHHASARALPGSPAAHRRAALLPSRLLRVAPAGPPLRIERRDGIVRLVAGGYRIEREAGGALRSAPEALAERIELALHDGARWRFFTASAAFDAPSFLGSLTPVLDAGPGRVARGVGRPLRIVDGRVEGLHPPAPGAVLDAAFSDDRHGAIVLEPGLAFATEDGGASWRALPLRDDAAHAVLADGQTRWIIGAEIALAVDREGTVREVSLSDVPRVEWSDDPEDVHAATAAREGDPVWALSRAVQTSVQVGERVLAFVRGHEIEYDLRADVLVMRAARALPCDPVSVFERAGLYALCAGGPDWQLFRRSSAGSWEPWIRTIAPQGEARGCIASSEGERIACPGPCVSEIRAAALESWCEREGQDAAHTLALPGGELVGYDGAAFVRVSSGTDPTEVTVSRGLDASCALTDEALATGLVLERSTPLRLGVDARLRIFVDDAAGTRVGYLEGAPCGRMVLHRAPEGSSALALGPPRIALALLAGGGLAQTDDESEHWHHLTNEATTPDARAMLEALAGDEPLRCGEGGCRVGEQLVRLGWGPPANSRLGARELLGTREPVRVASRWFCESTRAPLRVPEMDLAPTGDEAVFWHDGVAGLLVVRERRAPGAGLLLAEASWTAPARGTERTPRSVSLQLDRFVAPASSGATRWTLLDVAPDAALALRCGAGPAGLAPRCDLVRLEARRAELLVSLPPGRALVARGADAIAVLMREQDAAEGGGPVEAKLVILPRRGAPRVVPLALGSGRVGPYVDGSEAGVARYDEGEGTLILMPVQGEARFLRVSGREVCRASTRAEVALPWLGSLALAGAGTRDLDVLVRYGLDGDVSCAHSIEAEVQQLGAPGWLSALTEGTRASGIARTREGIVPVRCRAPFRSWPSPARGSEDMR